MASPFANVGMSQFGSESKYMPAIDSSGSSNDEPTFLGGLLATAVDKSGLKDWLNPVKTPTLGVPGLGVPAPNNSPLLPIAAGTPVNPYAAYAKQQYPATTSGYHPATDAMWADVTP